MTPNRVLLFSDIHASPLALKNLTFIVNRENLNGIVFAGDFVNNGQPLSFANDLVSTLDLLSVPFLWVPGNNDFGQGYKILSEKYPTLEGKVTNMFGQKFTGVGGSPDSWAGQYPGKSLISSKEVANSIFVSHASLPIAVNLLKEDLETNNSQQRHFSDAPLVHICGHVHNRWGVGYLGSTKVIKLASFFFGHYAIMDMESLKVEFKKAKLGSLLDH